MRPGIALALILAGCATVSSEHEDAALIARLQAQYGPTCAQQFAKDSEPYNYCIVGFYQRERADRAAALAPLLVPQPVVNPFYQDPNLLKPGGTNCTSFWSGGIVVTECK